MVERNERERDIFFLSHGLFCRSSAASSVREERGKGSYSLIDRRFVALVFAFRWFCTSLFFCLFLVASFLSVDSQRAKLFFSFSFLHRLRLFSFAYAAVDVDVPAVPLPPAAWPSVADDVEVLPPPPATPAPEAAAPPPSGNSEPKPGRPEVTAAVTAAPFPAAPPPVLGFFWGVWGQGGHLKERERKNEKSFGSSFFIIRLALQKKQKQKNISKHAPALPGVTATVVVAGPPTRKPLRDTAAPAEAADPDPLPPFLLFLPPVPPAAVETVEAPPLDAPPAAAPGAAPAAVAD